MKQDLKLGVTQWIPSIQSFSDTHWRCSNDETTLGRDASTAHWNAVRNLRVALCQSSKIDFIEDRKGCEFRYRIGSRSLEPKKEQANEREYSHYSHNW